MMAHTPHWLRERPPLRSRADQIRDEQHMDEHMPNKPERMVCEEVAKPQLVKAPPKRGLVLSH